MRESLNALGYQSFNPFGSMPGKAYPQSVRLFVAPAAEGWVRVLGGLDEAQLHLISPTLLCLYLTLDGATAGITVFENGTQAGANPLQPYLREGRTLADMERVLAGGSLGEPFLSVQKSKADLPLDVLPQDVQAMAGQVNAAQAQKLFSSLSGNFMKRFGKGDVEGAQALIGGSQADWSSAGGQQLAALAACLTLPENWRTPDFTSLRDAYQLHERRRRNPKAMLYPGDAEAMAAVPEALSYIPVYGGK